MEPIPTDPKRSTSNASIQEDTGLNVPPREFALAPIAERVPLTDKELDFLESQIPAQAAAATQAAFWNALTSGQSVVYADGDALYEIFPDGSRRFLESLPPNISLPTDTKFVLK